MRIVKKWGQFYFSFTGVKKLEEKGMRIHGRSVKELLINMKHKNLKFLEAAPGSENLLYHMVSLNAFGFQTILLYMTVLNETRLAHALR